MQIKKCDICKKEIKHSESMDVRVGYDHHELCKSCGSPVLKFLKKNKLVKKDEKE